MTPSVFAQSSGFINRDIVDATIFSCKASNVIILKEFQEVKQPGPVFKANFV